MQSEIVTSELQVSNNDIELKTEARMSQASCASRQTAHHSPARECQDLSQESIAAVLFHEPPTKAVQEVTETIIAAEVVETHQIKPSEPVSFSPRTDEKCSRSDPSSKLSRTSSKKRKFGQISKSDD